MVKLENKSIEKGNEGIIRFDHKKFRDYVVRGSRNYNIVVLFVMDGSETCDEVFEDLKKVAYTYQSAYKTGKIDK